jgi:lipopolysaccharide transport system ATP-binding protein
MPVALQIQKLSKAYYMRNEPYWALKDINLDIKQGDITGIIGSNGSGKSTLLKILSKITSPTTGQVTGKGKVISLLEAGTSFHPELSGAENIHLNGAMIGSSKAAINRKLEEIIDFADLQPYISLPLKKYSTGMQLRLAFSIVTHLEPDILILDEILAVADAGFQQQCLSKLKLLNNESGTTILFVSHHASQLTAICNKGFILHQGTTTGICDILTIMQDYEKLNH